MHSVFSILFMLFVISTLKVKKNCKEIDKLAGKPDKFATKSSKLLDSRELVELAFYNSALGP